MSWATDYFLYLFIIKSKGGQRGRDRMLNGKKYSVLGEDKRSSWNGK